MKQRLIVLLGFGAGLLAALGGGGGLWAAPTTLQGPSGYLPEQLQGEVFYVPVADGTDEAAIRSAKSNGAKLNGPFYEKYHAPLVAAVRSFAQKKSLSVRDQVLLFGWLVVETHKANKIGYLWGGDLTDAPNAGGSTSGIGYDCSGYVWSVWEAIAPQSAFANGGERCASHDYLKLGRQVFPRAKVDKDFMEQLQRLAQPGDAIIDPDGHIMLYGYDPRTADRKPIVLENGEFWNYLDKWELRNKGKSLEVRSTFDEQGRMILGKGGALGRALPALGKPAPIVVAPGVGGRRSRRRRDRRIPRPHQGKQPVAGQRPAEHSDLDGGFRGQGDAGVPSHGRARRPERIRRAPGGTGSARGAAAELSWGWTVWIDWTNWTEWTGWTEWTRWTETRLVVRLRSPEHKAGLLRLIFSFFRLTNLLALHSESGKDFCSTDSPVLLQRVDLIDPGGALRCCWRPTSETRKSPSVCLKAKNW
ncbi:MAG: hypothetical protein NTW86_26440 [Candidatus Sumerlaeota bacterium]|nr:hypothetical protein [Candidatus Sumerlaeota bacterium]